MAVHPKVVFISFLLIFLASTAGAQQTAPRPLITQAVDESRLVTLKGNTHPLAKPEFDIGVAPPDMPLRRMLMVLRRSPEQEFALHKLLDDQQDKASPSYRKWLTPDEFGAQFGPADQDLQIVTGWLQSHGLEVNRVTHGRTIIEFTGAESQVEEALHTQIHKYLVNGEEQWANVSDPQIPAALAPVVAGVASLNNFPRKPLSKLVGTYSPKTRSLISAGSQFTFGSGNCYQGTCYAVGPADFGSIYNMQSLWNSGIDGTGETIAIVGESDINLQDVHDFRNLFGLPQNDPIKILDGPNPGPRGDESEADIDVEWSGAIAPNATIDFVLSESTETTFGIDLSAIYIIDHNLAPVMSESYGICELGLGTSGNQFYNSLWSQAAAQGITVILAAGDSGSSGCTENVANYGLNVSGFASTPFNVAIGGTDFNDLTNAQQYWGLNNDTTTQESAKGYIPETTWNLSCTNSIFLNAFGYPDSPENNCNNSQIENAGLVDSVGGSGGVSNCTTNSQALGTCSGGYTKPSWQVAPGVPNDNKRDLPDISLFASNGVMNNFYIYCRADSPYPFSANCSVGQFGAAGGTSFGAPIFAAIMALINQQTQSKEGQGNANYVLYKLAGQQSASSCNSSNGSGSSCIFNDITSGTIAMPCVAGSPNCTVKTAGHQFGVLSGYSTGTGYDLATGLGSLNVANLVNAWKPATQLFRATTTTLALGQTSGLTHGQAVTVSGGVAPSSTGPGTPTGNVSLLTSTGMSVDGFKLINGALSGSTDLLPGGTYTVSAHYAGDSTFGGSDSSPVSVTVGKEASNTQLQLVTFDFKGNLVSNNASTAAYGSPYLLRVNVLNSLNASCQPNPLGESACPTGNVTLTDNSSALDGGTFALNSLGYTEDQIVQFPGGSNSVKAQYAGDNSFDASSTTTTYTINPAATTISAPTIGFAQAGANFTVTATVSAQSLGAAPGGTITFFANGTPVSGTPSYTPSSNAATATATLDAFLTSSSTPFPTAGTYSITASYSGDANYAASNSSSVNLAVQYPIPTVTISPSNPTVAAGSSLTASVVVEGFSKTAPAPTGTVQFQGAGIDASQNVNYQTITGPNGSPSLQATLTFTPPGDEIVSGLYSGDANYPQNVSNEATVTVTGNDFGLSSSPTSVNVTPGGIVSVQVNVLAQSNYTGTINFSPSSCSGLPKESTCSFNPPSVTGQGFTQITVSTTALHTVPQAARMGTMFWVAGLSFPMAAIFLVVGVPRRNTWRSLGMSLLTAVFLLSVGCGGGSSSGIGGGSTDPGTPAGSYTITVTATSGSGTAATTHTTTFTLVVQ